MSHALALVKFNKDDKVVFAEYDATADILRHRVFESYEELETFWREEQPKLECITEHSEYELAEVYVDYGGGFSFSTHLCRDCMSFVEDMKIDILNTSDVRPEWVNAYKDYLFDE